MPRREIAIKHATILAAYLLVVWGFYRMLFRLPEEIEEPFIKPLIWLIPVLYLLKKEKLDLTSIGITAKNLFPAIYLALGLGVIFAIEGVLINFVKYGGINFSANIGQRAFLSSLGLSFASAISEEITFRGYLFSRIWHVLDKEWQANIVTSIVWALVHVPIAIFWWNLSFVNVLGYLILITIYGFGSAFIFARTKNVFSSILLYVMWAWPIVLFR